jgi:O-antigen/teichoic acid export membrane protein
MKGRRLTIDQIAIKVPPNTHRAQHALISDPYPAKEPSVFGGKPKTNRVENVSHYKLSELIASVRSIVQPTTTSAGIRPGDNPILRSGLASVALKVASLVLGVLLNVLLARTLGPVGIGVYSAVIAVVALLSVPADLGLQSLVIREIATYEVRGDWSLLRGVLRFSFAITTMLALLLGATAALVVHLAGPGFDTEYGATMAWGLLSLPFLALGGLRGAALRGLRHVVTGQLPEFAILPALTLVLIAGYQLAFGDLSPTRAMFLRTVAGTVAFAVGAVMLSKAIPGPVKKHTPTYHRSRWARSALPLAVARAVAVLQSQIPIVVLSIFRSPEEVGLYAIANQGALLVTFILNALGLVMMPYVSRLWVSRDTAALQVMITTGTRVIVLASLPIALLFFVKGSVVLRLVFGTEFSAAYPLLAILSTAQLVHALTGVSGLLLSMTGFEREYAIMSGTLTLLSVVATVLLVPSYGAVGAASVAAGYLITLKVIATVAAKRQTGINTSILARRAVNP